MKRNCFFQILLVTGIVLLIVTACKKKVTDQFLTEPTVVAFSARSITSTSAVIDVSVTNDGGQTIAERGICWTTMGTPTISGHKIVDGTGSVGDFTATMTDLTPVTTYYYRAYATNSIGTAYSSEFSFTTKTVAKYDNYGGGIVSYISIAGDPGYVNGEVHGLVTTANDLSTGIAWNNGSDISVATNNTLGSGNYNTNAIVAAQGSGNYAAKLCSDLILNGYSDWYLPSLDEFSRICSVLTLNDPSVRQYWTSSQSSPSMAWCYSSNAYTNTVAKSTLFHVRAIRNF
jgi:hypothetical protein